MTDDLLDVLGAETTRAERTGDLLADVRARYPGNADVTTIADRIGAIAADPDRELPSMRVRLRRAKADLESHGIRISGPGYGPKHEHADAQLTIAARFDAGGHARSFRVTIVGDDSLRTICQSIMHAHLLQATITHTGEIVGVADPADDLRVHAMELGLTDRVTRDIDIVAQFVALGCDNIHGVMAWMDHGFTPQTAAPWIVVLNDGRTARDWRDAGNTPADLQEWMSASPALGDWYIAGPWKYAGYTAAQAGAWCATRNPQLLHFSGAESFIAAGMAADEVAAWHPVGTVRPEVCQIQAWQRVGLTAADVADLAATGHDVLSIDRFVAECRRVKSIPFDELLAWAKIGPEFAHGRGRAPFRNAGMNPAVVADIKRRFGDLVLTVRFVQQVLESDRGR